MTYPVIKGASYSLVHAPNMLLEYGTTPSGERQSNPGSEFMRKLPGHLRAFEECVAYPPNQVYIGNMMPDDLRKIPRPWHKTRLDDAARHGKYGSIFTEDEFIAALAICDSFDLVRLESKYCETLRETLASNDLFSAEEMKKLRPHDLADIETLVSSGVAVPIRKADELVGCVRQAHASDPVLNAHVMLENLAAKCSGLLVMKTLFKTTGLKPEKVDYIIETSEEACGDMNQRGGGNFAKAIGEAAGCSRATGADVRAFCAAPAHGIVLAASLVKAGIYKNVVVVAGGTTAKLGLNARDHVNKGLPVLEDMIGMFAVHVSENDGVNPIVRTDLVGRHRIGSGSSPQAVIQAIVADPLENAGLKIQHIDKYSPEMQNPDITEPAGAGDVPKSNYKMIGALAVKKGELERAKLDEFVEKHGLPGYAPTQGHIPSGVPFIGAARDLIMAGSLNRVMIVGKGSLFLGRMTSQFDGVSFVVEPNPGEDSEAKQQFDELHVRKIVAQAMRDVAARLCSEQE